MARTTRWSPPPAPAPPKPPAPVLRPPPIERPAPARKPPPARPPRPQPVQPAAPVQPPAQPLPLPATGDGLQLHDVGFAYPSRPGQPSLSGISLAIRPGEQVALVFGNETFGLSIDEVEQCNRLVTVPGNPDYFSLNLAMAVQVMTYELFSHSGVSVDYLKPEDRTATLGEVDSFCGHLEAAMADVGYLEHRNSERLLRRMRTLFHRAALQREEIDILRGFFKQAQRFADGTLPPRKKSGD